MGNGISAHIHCRHNRQKLIIYQSYIFNFEASGALQDDSQASI